MSLNVSISTQKTVETIPAVTVVVPAGDVVIERIVDNPVDKIIEVELADIGYVKLSSLSDSNYPSDWTYAEIKTAVTNYLG
jgi:hypothetical protein